MKKRYFHVAFVMFLLMLFSACAPGVSAEPLKAAEPSEAEVLLKTTEPQQTSSPTMQQIEPARTEPGIETVSEEPTKPLQIDENINAMLPVMDSVIRAMRETGSIYAPCDDTFFWVTLYLMSVNYGEPLQMAEVKSGQVTVKKPAIQQLAASCFENCDELPEIPDALSGSVSFSKGKNTYMFAVSDIGDSTTEIMNVEPDGDTTKVTVEFISWDEAENYVFTLVPNLNDSSELVFLYRVRAAERF